MKVTRNTVGQAGVVLLATILTLLPMTASRAVQMNGNYVTSAPTVANWNTGWAESGVTGWNYLGQVNGRSAVYLGNGWVATAGHVGIGNFMLAGQTYIADANTLKPIMKNGTADIILFHLLSQPSLPGLIISTTLPVAFSATVSGTSVVMLGYGGNSGLTWGVDTVTETNVSVTPNGFSYVTIDFLADYGTDTRGTSQVTNTTLLVDGDSGGGDFVFNSATSKWELAGINEVVGSYIDTNQTFSGMVQLNKYATQINAIVATQVPTDTPAMPWMGLAVLGCALAFVASRSLRSQARL